MPCASQPYDAPTVLEIDPVSHTLKTFGYLGTEPCKWYGGVLAPNNKIYAIPYASQYVLEISPENRTAIFFAKVGTGWGKWSGGVLARNGKIYGIPSQSTSILEIDVNSRMTTTYGHGVIPTYGHGVIPGGGHPEDKWNGGVLAPNGVPASRPLMRHRRASSLIHCLPPAQARSTASHGAAAPSSSSIRRPWPSVSSGSSSPQPTTLCESKPSISVCCPSSRSLPLTRPRALAAGTVVCASATGESWLSRTTRRPSSRLASGCACPRMPQTARAPR